LPWFESTILKPIYDNGFRFESDNFISEFRAPVMILHAEKDRVIPMELGYNLYRKALETRGKSWGPVEFHRFHRKYGHTFIVRAENFANILDQFIRRYKNESY
jgi:abhydrolase domain-containing protein 12